MRKKREIFRQCFDNLDYDRIAAYVEADVEHILSTEGMIYSHLQACGIINDHDRDCPCRNGSMGCIPRSESSGIMR